MTNSQAQAAIERLFPYPANIGHDDPNAEQLLNDKLEALNAKHECFKAINKIVDSKKYGIREKIVYLTKVNEGITEEIAQGILHPDSIGRYGLPSYVLTNNKGVINSVKERILKIQRVENMAEFCEKRNGVEISIDKDLNRITVDFDKRPSPQVCAHLKSYGYRWAPSKSMWLGNIDRYRLDQAKKVWDMVEPEPTKAVAFFQEVDVIPVRATAKAEMC